MAFLRLHSSTAISEVSPVYSFDTTTNTLDAPPYTSPPRIRTPPHPHKQKYIFEGKSDLELSSE